MRPKNKKIRGKIVRLWDKGIRKPKKIAEITGLNRNLVKYYIHTMRKEGLLPSDYKVKELLDSAITELKLAAIKVTSLYVSDEKNKKIHLEVRIHVEKALEYLTIYKKMRGVMYGK